ncbi:MAG: NAD+ synthase [Candidatus Parvarchaeum sp.]
MEIPSELRINEKSAVEYTVKWVKDYFKPLKTKKAVIGLSGGGDSTFTAYVCRIALGKENVLGVIMPSDSNPEEDEKDAYAVAKAIGISAKTIDISPIMKAIERENPELKEEKNRIARANIKARLRMLLLYKEANESNALVAGTDDRSEHALGYYTKYGDGGVDINVPEHLYKMQVRQILLWIGENENMGIFEKIAEKVPSPRLWKGQTAENELDIHYEDIDRILYTMNEKKIRTAERIANQTGIKKSKVMKVLKMMQKNAHKNTLPPSPPIRYFN